MRNNRPYLTALVAGLALALGAWLIAQSQIITTLDQGDYDRAISPFINGAVEANYRHWEKPAMEWRLREPLAPLLESTNTASGYFMLNAYAQGLVRSTFSLPLLSITSKVLLLGLLALLARAIGGEMRWGLLIQGLVFALLAVVFFMAHNIYLLQSFYQEHVFWLGLPLLLFGLLESHRTHSRWSEVWIIIGATLCGAAKTQFFYLPFLVLMVQWANNRWDGKRTKSLVIVGLVIAQGLCTLPLLSNPFRALNYYHATYYGSYLAASPQTRAELQIPAQTEGCIGSDRWGVVLTGKNGDERGKTIPSCFDAVKLTTLDVIRPYLIEPAILWRMWRFAEPALWTSQPFHNIRTHPYPITPAGLDASGVPYPFPERHPLVKLSAWRERFATHQVEAASLLSLALIALLLWRRITGLAFTMLFLVALMWSQIALALIGEGYRDLGKHFAAAQLSYDLLLVWMALAVLGLAISFLSNPAHRRMPP